MRVALKQKSVTGLLQCYRLELDARSSRVCHPERSEAQSKDPVEVTFKVASRDPSTSLGMTRCFATTERRLQRIKLLAWAVFSVKVRLPLWRKPRGLTATNASATQCRNTLRCALSSK